MDRSEKERLDSELARAGGSPSRLAVVFAGLEARLGRATASQLWWAAFGAKDAAET
jgi:hypothetical protein